MLSGEVGEVCRLIPWYPFSGVQSVENESNELELQLEPVDWVDRDWYDGVGCCSWAYIE